MWEEASVSNRWKDVQFLNASQETLPEAVCRTDGSTRGGLTKYHNNYLYRDIFIKYCTVFKICVPPSSTLNMGNLLVLGHLLG